MLKNAKSQKTFNPYNLPQELRENHKALIRSYIEAEKSGNIVLAESFFDKAINLVKDEEVQFYETHEAEPPNESCDFAVVKGLLIENAQYTYEYNNGEYFRVNSDFTKGYNQGITPLFEFPFEQVYLWCFQERELCSLLSQVDSKVKIQKWWKTLASCLRIAVALDSLLSEIPETGYNWIYHFDSCLKPQQQDFFYDDHILFGTFNGGVIKPDYLAQLAPILELLISDERFFTAASNLISAHESHEFCLHCATYSESRHNHDLNLWEISDTIPKMEVAIVQATQTCEGILGKPGKNKERVLLRWQETIDIAPVDIFYYTGESYFDFYHYLFDIRGNAAHSLGRFPYEVSRTMTIQAQTFAWEILRSYYSKHCKSHKQALKDLKFNESLLSPIFLQSLEDDRLSNQPLSL